MSTTRSAPGPPGSDPPAPERYRLALYGGGTEEVDKFALRDRIRRGELDGKTVVARVGSDDWRPMSDYPELRRYLEMATAARPAPASPGAKPSLAPPAEPMLERAVKGAAYPLSIGGFLTILGLLLLSILPLIGLLAIPATSVYVLSIVRRSASGEKNFPDWSDADDVWETIALWLRTVAVSIIALWPVIAWTLFWFATTSRKTETDALVRLGVGAGVAFLVSMVYYPACLATVAVWDSVLDSLNPSYVFRVIRTVGGDYLFVIVMWVVATGAAVAVSIPLRLFFGDIPIVGHLPSRLPGLWAQFYTAHLLGWAVHRHSTDLGWD
jgi:hypothetical protein